MSANFTKVDPFKIYKWGDAELSQRTDIRYRSQASAQDYETLKAQFAGKGWSDPLFPHDNMSIGARGRDTANLTLGKYVGPIRWFRIKDFLNNQRLNNFNPYDIIEPGTLSPKFLCGSLSDARKDIHQGGLGSCFFVASVSAIAMVEKVLTKAVPLDNTDDKDSGVYHFRFWYQGCWTDVPIDDWLPFEEQQDGTYKPYASKFHVVGQEAEVWAQLIEKAYAKLHGSYEKINGGWAYDSLQKLTGGFVESYPLQRGPFPSDLFEQMRKSLEKDCLIAVTCYANTYIPEKTLESWGLCTPHVYTITEVATVQTTEGSRISDVDLVRIRNPHGRTEWKGKWSDYKEKTWRNYELENSWAYVSEEQKAKLQIESKDDGEFWMAYEDMVQWFMQMDIVSFIDEDEVNKPGFVFEEYDGTFSHGKDGEFQLNIGKTPDQEDGYLFAEISQKVSTKQGMYDTSFDLFENKPEPVAPQSNQYDELDFGNDPRYAFLYQQFQNLSWQQGGYGGQQRKKIKPVEGTTSQKLSVALAYKLKPGEYTLRPTGMNNGDKLVIRILYSKAG